MINTNFNGVPREEDALPSPRRPRPTAPPPPAPARATAQRITPAAPPPAGARMRIASAATPSSAGSSMFAPDKELLNWEPGSPIVPGGMNWDPRTGAALPENGWYDFADKSGQVFSNNTENMDGGTVMGRDDPIYQEIQKAFPAAKTFKYASAPGNRTIVQGFDENGQEVQGARQMFRTDQDKNFMGQALGLVAGGVLGGGALANLVNGAGAGLGGLATGSSLAPTTAAAGGTGGFNASAALSSALRTGGLNALTTALRGGDLSQILRSGLTGAVTGGVGSGVASALGGGAFNTALGRLAGGAAGGLAGGHSLSDALRGGAMAGVTSLGQGLLGHSFAPTEGGDANDPNYSMIPGGRPEFQPLEQTSSAMDDYGFGDGSDFSGTGFQGGSALTDFLNSNGGTPDISSGSFGDMGGADLGTLGGSLTGTNWLTGGVGGPSDDLSSLFGLGSDGGTGGAPTGGGDPVRAALYGDAGYGSGMSGSETSAYDDSHSGGGLTGILGQIGGALGHLGSAAGGVLSGALSGDSGSLNTIAKLLGLYGAYRAATGHGQSAPQSPGQLQALVGGAPNRDWSESQRASAQKFFTSPLTKYQAPNPQKFGVDPLHPSYTNNPSMYRRGGGVQVPHVTMSSLNRIASDVRRVAGGRGRYVTGMAGGGQEDNVDARLSPGEYVMDADVVSALGDGNNEEGARKLDMMRERIRQHKRSAPASQIPPMAHDPMQYLKKGR